MAITSISEAHAVNTLLDHLCDLPRADGKPPDAMAALDAARLLADKAHDKLMAGITAGQVVQHFTGRVHAVDYSADVTECLPCHELGSDGACPYHRGVEAGVRHMADALRGRCPSVGAAVDELVEDPDQSTEQARRYRATQEVSAGAVSSE